MAPRLPAAATALTTQPPAPRSHGVTRGRSTGSPTRHSRVSAARVMRGAHISHYSTQPFPVRKACRAPRSSRLPGKDGDGLQAAASGRGARRWPALTRCSRWHRGPAPPAVDGSGFPLPCLLGFRSARLSDVFDEVSRDCENRDRVLPEREDYEGTLDGEPIGNDFLIPAVLVRDSVVCSHVDITFGTSGICRWIRLTVVCEAGVGAAEPGPGSARRPSPHLLHARPVRFTTISAACP